VKHEAFLCPFCGAPFREPIPAGVVQVKCRYCGATALVPSSLGVPVQRCPNHPETLAIGLCGDCGKSYCDRCLHILKTFDQQSSQFIHYYICRGCLKKRNAQAVKRVETARKLGYVILSSGLLVLLIGLANVHALAGDPFAILGGIGLFMLGIVIILVPSQAIKAESLHKKVEEAKLDETAEVYLYMLDEQTSLYGAENGKLRLDEKINAYRREGYVIEEAIRKVAKDEKYVI